MVDPGVDDADESVVHPEVEPQQAKEARWHHSLEKWPELCTNYKYKMKYVLGRQQKIRGNCAERFIQ